MATHVYACLVGEWVNLSDDPDCKIGSNHSSPFIWWEENAEIWSPIIKAQEHSMYQLDHVHIHFKNKDYRISPIFLQIVEG